MTRRIVGILKKRARPSAVALAGLWKALVSLEFAMLTGAMARWAALNVARLYPWFGDAAVERRMQVQLTEAYGAAGSDVHSR